MTAKTHKQIEDLKKYLLMNAYIQSVDKNDKKVKMFKGFVEAINELEVKCEERF